MRWYVIAILFVLTFNPNRAQAEETCTTVADAADAEISQLNPTDQNVLGLVKVTLERGNEDELSSLTDSLRLEDPNAQAFWSEVLKVAGVYNMEPVCQDRLLVLSYYSYLNHMKMDEKCHRDMSELFTEERLEELGLSMDLCLRMDPMATARFERAATYLEVRYPKYKCHCEKR